MTLPAEPMPDAATDWSLAEAGTPASDSSDPAIPDQGQRRPQPEQGGLSSPLAFFAVIAVGVLVLIGCVLGAMLTGLFGDFSVRPTEARTAPVTDLDVRREPAAVFSDGKWLVTKDVQPGTYKSTVPAGSAGCSWERNASTDGTASSVLDSGVELAGARVAVTIKTTDAMFQSLGCGTWRRIGD